MRGKNSGRGGWEGDWVAMGIGTDENRKRRMR